MDAAAAGARAAARAAAWAALVVSPSVPPAIPQRDVRENFPVALRILPARMRSDLQSLYRFARYVDDLGDDFAGPREPALRAVADDLHRLYADERAEIAEVAGLAALRSGHVPIQPFLALVQANLQDQIVTRYESFTDLLGYCALSADPVGRVVLHIVGAIGAPDSPGAEGGSVRRRPPTVDPAAMMDLSDRICTGLQLLEHWQDIGEDYRAGRIYLPQQDMRRFGVDEADLAGPKVTPPLRELLRFETDRALAYLNAGAPLVPALPRWGRLAVSGYLAGGRAAAAELRRQDFEVLGAECQPAGWRVAAAWLLGRMRSAG